MTLCKVFVIFDQITPYVSKWTHHFLCKQSNSYSCSQKW